jgi:hypothetical protein
MDAPEKSIFFTFINLFLLCICFDLNFFLILLFNRFPKSFCKIYFINCLLFTSVNVRSKPLLAVRYESQVYTTI